MERLPHMKLLGLELSNGLVAVSLVCGSIFATSAVAQTPVIEYFEVHNDTEVGIGFVSDDKNLYVGGCGVFLIAERRPSDRCIFPQGIRWATVTADGTRLFATTFDPSTSKSTSFQLDAATGAVLGSKKGIHFAPPIAIHPTNQFWVGVRAAGNYQGPETIDVVSSETWKSVRRGVPSHVRRIFKLEFSEGGRFLLINGGPPLGAVLDAKTWQTARSSNTQLSSSLGNNGRFSVGREGGGLKIVDMTNGQTVGYIAMETSPDAPQLAFSQNGQWGAVKGYIERNGVKIYAFALIKFPR